MSPLACRDHTRARAKEREGEKTNDDGRDATGDPTEFGSDEIDRHKARRLGECDDLDVIDAQLKGHALDDLATADRDDIEAASQHLHLADGCLNVVIRDGTRARSTQLSHLCRQIGHQDQTSLHGRPLAHADLDGLHGNLVVKVSNIEDLGPETLVGFPVRPSAALLLAGCRREREVKRGTDRRADRRRSTGTSGESVCGTLDLC